MVTAVEHSVFSWVVADVLSIAPTPAGCRGMPRSPRLLWKCVIESSFVHNAGTEVSIIEQRLDGGQVSPFPLLRCRNVFVLPGIPTLLQKKWQVCVCVCSGTGAAGGAVRLLQKKQGLPPTLGGPDVA